ncbi:MAG TPA: hypothetical protein VKY74_07935 [Chloroflexia bacterium]|nr:hypothetical protein [Chloroflexia bacterium]
MKTLYVTTRAAWRIWLHENHASATEIWLIFYKKHTQLPSIGYEEAVEEALCFGWIDSIVKTIDAEQYAQKFTPRKQRSNWSASNKRRVRQMIAAGQMTPAGLAKITFPFSDADPTTDTGPDSANQDTPS